MLQRVIGFKEILELLFLFNSTQNPTDLANTLHVISSKFRPWPKDGAIKVKQWNIINLDFAFTTAHPNGVKKNWLPLLIARAIDSVMQSPLISKYLLHRYYYIRVIDTFLCTWLCFIELISAQIGLFSSSTLHKHECAHRRCKQNKTEHSAGPQNQSNILLLQTSSMFFFSTMLIFLLLLLLLLSVFVSSSLFY